MSKKFRTAQEIADLSLEALEEQLKQEYLPEIIKGRTATRDRVTIALEGGNFRKAAVETKGQALWDILKMKNIRTVMSQQTSALTVLWETFGNRSTSALTIFEVLNAFTYDIHLDLCAKGYTFAEVVHQYNADPYVQTATYLRATESPDMKTILETIAKEKHQTTEMLVSTTLERLAIMYAAENIKQNIVLISAKGNGMPN